jgi:pyridoxamine 5'-phosphate oxidase-like protein
MRVLLSILAIPTTPTEGAMTTQTQKRASGSGTSKSKANTGFTAEERSAMRDRRLGRPWGEFAAQAPELADFGARRLAAVPAYLATVDDSGAPRVHPVTPIIGDGRLFLFMEPTSPKGDDLVRRGAYALHCHVPDAKGTGGEFYIRGRGERVDSPRVRAIAVQAASYAPHDRYVLFELSIDEARCNGYGDVALPESRSWRVADSSP